ncbi:unnamed protein product [Amaranthus hypochondriacus]
MPNSYFPLSWESTGDQWWYATPIDWAAANGLSDLVKQLLCIDPNLLIKLTSLRRTRRLELVWEDPDNLKATDARPCNDITRCRARVARALLMDCEPKQGDGLQSNSLMRAGYGGWLLYTAASAGDLGFVKELLERDPDLVFGEGEYGVTDILYAAARSKDSEVFRVVFESAMNVNEGGCHEVESFVDEMVCRAVHAAARAGNLELLKELLVVCSDVLGYRDSQGSTILHSASSRGQLQVVKYLIATIDTIIDSTDNQGNTALHVAAYRGHSSVVQILAQASPSLTTSRNSDGNTFLHMAVAGFRSPGFHRIDKQIELIKLLTTGAIVNLENIINNRNNEGRTALHIAVTKNIQCNVVEYLMSVPSINLSIRDDDGLTPLDLLRRCPKTVTSDPFIEQHREQGIGTSPGTSFRLPDAELCPFSAEDNESDINCELPSSRFSSCSSEVTSHFDSENSKKSSKRLRFLLRFLKKSDGKFAGARRDEEHNDVDTSRLCRSLDNELTPLRQKYSRALNPSHSAREKFAASLMQGVMQATPPKSCFSLSRYSTSSPFSRSLASSPSSLDKRMGDYEGKSVGKSSFFSGPLHGERSVLGDRHKRVSSFNKSLMNQYFCFGAQGLAIEDSDKCTRSNSSCRRLVF